MSKPSAVEWRRPPTPDEILGKPIKVKPMTMSEVLVWYNKYLDESRMHRIILR